MGNDSRKEFGYLARRPALRLYEPHVVQVVGEVDSVNVGNQERYLKDADVERQLTLESYGYRFLRINRFNIGADPVATLDARLAKLVELATGEQSSVFVERLRTQAAGITSREMKSCSRCQAILPQARFFDQTLKAGQGGYGRVCMDCKAKDRTAARSWR